MCRYCFGRILSYIDPRHRHGTLNDSTSDSYQHYHSVPVVFETSLAESDCQYQLRLLAAPRHVFPTCRSLRHSPQSRPKSCIRALVCWASRGYGLVDVSEAFPSTARLTRRLKSLYLLRLYPHSDDRILATGIIKLATNSGIIIGAAGST